MDIFVQTAINSYDIACEKVKTNRYGWRDEGSESVPELPIKDNAIICSVCGKRFAPAPQHIYKHYRTKAKVCTYSCAAKSEREYFDGSTLQRTPMKQRILAEIEADNQREQEKLRKKAEKAAARNARAQATTVN